MYFFASTYLIDNTIFYPLISGSCKRYFIKHGIFTLLSLYILEDRFPALSDRVYVYGSTILRIGKIKINVLFLKLIHHESVKVWPQFINNEVPREIRNLKTNWKNILFKNRLAFDRSHCSRVFKRCCSLRLSVLARSKHRFTIHLKTDGTISAASFVIEQSGQCGTASVKHSPLQWWRFAVSDCVYFYFFNYALKLWTIRNT